MLESVERKAKQEILDIWLDAHDDAKTGRADPMFEAIEKHRNALVVASGDEHETLQEFPLTEPTTISGALAALEFACHPTR